MAELNLRFPDESNILVTFDGEESGQLPFVNPITAKDRQDLQWYLEIYGAHSLGDPDDEEATRIAARLPELGKALFDAVFQGPALRLFHRFQDQQDGTRLLTVSAEHPEILALPWELLHDSAVGGVYLFLETPRISIRRRVTGATGGRAPFKVKPKERLHLLFVVSRPEGAGFLDPRADPKAVLDAIEEQAPGHVTWEFLHPPTLDALVERLEDAKRPPVDILHFDGHGVFEDGTGYLLFETADGDIDFVAAERLGESLRRFEVALVILSACQSAALAETTAGQDGEPADLAMGSVAVRLTTAGLPAVLAMTQSVLVATTRALFGELYKQLAGQLGLGEALDNARQHLSDHPEKYQVQRGLERVWLRLQDWFVPNLYQSGADQPLLCQPEPSAAAVPLPPARTNLPPPPKGAFFGRQWELWQIERWFAGSARRVTLTGFGGQGKTALAQEAGRWLVRIGMFKAAAFVDYSRIQTADALAVAVSQLGTVLDTSLPDAEAARLALVGTPTLVILDNLEALAEEPLRELLDAAVDWSNAGDSRVLLTTRRPDFGHAGYQVEGTRVHRRIQLEGLGSREAPDDALEWFGELMKLPPAPTVPSPRREELIDLFEKVKFHPLSIRVLAEQLKSRRWDELGERLEQLLVQPASMGGSDETLPELVASLQISFERLGPAAQTLLLQLGVFQGGALESQILDITEIPEVDWRGLRDILEASALLQTEDLPGVTTPFLSFHPTLGPMLRRRLDPGEQAALSKAHQHHYLDLAKTLYNADFRTPHQARAIAIRELPNLLHAVHQVLDESDTEAAVFAHCVIRFLGFLGLSREIEALSLRSLVAAKESDSDSRYLAQSSLGEQLLEVRRVTEAAEIFRDILDRLKEGASFEKAETLCRLGRCMEAGGQPGAAERDYRAALAVLDQLPLSNRVSLQRGHLLTDLADALMFQGRYSEAREAYEGGLELVQELGDIRAQGISMGQLGILAMYEEKFEEAVGRHQASLGFFQQLGEPASEAIARYQLGVVLLATQQLEEAERHYREAARIFEAIDNPAMAARVFNALATVHKSAGKSTSSEAWYRKALEKSRQLGDKLTTARVLSSLAKLLLAQPGRLGEAQQVAEEALATMKALGVSELYNNYWILAEIAEQGEHPGQARSYRWLARQAKRNSADTHERLRESAPLILAVCAACRGSDEARQLVAEHQAAMRRGGEDWARVADTIDRILAGERDADALNETLGLAESIVVEAILDGIEDPSTLQGLLPANE